VVVGERKSLKLCVRGRGVQLVPKAPLLRGVADKEEKSRRADIDRWGAGETLGGGNTETTSLVKGLERQEDVPPPIAPLR